KEVHKRISGKKISVREKNSKIKQTRDDMQGERMKTDEVLDRNSHGAVGDIEKQSSLTEALRDRVRGKLKSFKTVQEEKSSEKHHFDTKEETFEVIKEKQGKMGSRNPVTVDAGVGKLKAMDSNILLGQKVKLGQSHDQLQRMKSP
ncbi:UNVERIFIED_CONTAM: hypothetical protein K2H54_034668, partial [Gekko kuhli]